MVRARAARRQVKESLLGDSAPERITLSLPGAGSRLIGGGLQTELARQEVQELLIDGFFPFVKLDEKPLLRRSGFQEFGLPYAADAAITRYLAAFLMAHRDAASADANSARPDVVLFNGGVFDAPLLRRRLLQVIQAWFPGADGKWEPRVLENDRRDLAVARGAAYYGMVRRGQGVRIAAGLARTYFIGVAAGDGAAAAVCLAPADVEEGESIELTGARSSC